MLNDEEIEALSSCVGSAIGEFGVSETTDLATQAIAKLRAAQQSVQKSIMFYCNVCKETNPIQIVALSSDGFMLRCSVSVCQAEHTFEQKSVEQTRAMDANPGSEKAL